MMGPTRKRGGDNPDCTYYLGVIDGSETYRLVGKRGGAHFVAFSTARPAESVPEGESAEVGRLLGDELETAWDGSFVVTVGPEEQPGNWVRTTPEVDKVWIRQFFGDWVAEEPMTVRIERVGAEGAPPRLTPERLMEGLEAAGRLSCTRPSATGGAGRSTTARSPTASSNPPRRAASGPRPAGCRSTSTSWCSRTRRC